MSVPAHIAPASVGQSRAAAHHFGAAGPAQLQKAVESKKR